MKKILLSIGTLAIVGVVVAGATGAIFSDTEVSTGNTFTAGAIDLTIDNESYYNGVFSTSTSWLQRDLDGELFFDFRDLKPGDYGEDTISLHVNDNDSWLCADVKLTSNQDNGSTEPELNDENPYTGSRGELADNVNFIWWADDGDNVYETGEVLLPAGSLGNLAVGQTATVALADLNGNIWDESGPLLGGSAKYIGKAWCFGNLTETPVTQDGHGDQLDPTVNPGFTCDGSQENNETQTDSLTADISFRAVQSRHNESFVCDLGGPVVEQRHISLENKDKDNEWEIISDDLIWGDIDYSHNDTTFHGIVTGQGLEPTSKYQITLNGPGICTATDAGFAGMGPNAFSSGYWNAGTNLESSCGTPGEGVYNMDLVGDYYTIITDGAGAFTYNFNIALPAGDYSGVKVLVKKMLDTHVSPWSDTGQGYPAFNLYETASISFTVVN